jgi:hypothetical protein
MKVLKMRKAVLGLAILWVFWFVVSGCDNGTTTDIGTAPTLTDVIVASSVENLTTNWTSASTFSKTSDTIYIGAKGNDPDKDVVKFGYDVMYNGSSVYQYETSGTGGEAFTIPIETFTAHLGSIFASSFNVVNGYSLRVYVIDAKGNKSNVKETNTFEIIN